MLEVSCGHLGSGSIGVAAVGSLDGRLLPLRGPAVGGRGGGGRGVPSRPGARVDNFLLLTFIKNDMATSS